jgi:hypothetical protein
VENFVLLNRTGSLKSIVVLSIVNSVKWEQSYSSQRDAPLPHFELVPTENDWSNSAGSHKSIHSPAIKFRITGLLIICTGAATAEYHPTTTCYRIPLASRWEQTRFFIMKARIIAGCGDSVFEDGKCSLRTGTGTSGWYSDMGGEHPVAFDSTTENHPRQHSKVSDNTGASGLFVLWEWKELKILLPGILSAALVAGAKSAFAVVLGLIFEEVSRLGGGATTAAEALSQISKLCLVLTGLGVFKAVASAVFMGLWIAHGESRIRTVRARLFDVLCRRRLEWFDMQEDGFAGLTTEIQRLVVLSRKKG